MLNAGVSRVSSLFSIFVPVRVPTFADAEPKNRQKLHIVPCRHEKSASAHKPTTLYWEATVCTVHT